MSNGQAAECDDDISPRGSRWGWSTFTALPLWARPNPTLDRGISSAPQAVKVTHINTHSGQISGRLCLCARAWVWNWDFHSQGQSLLGWNRHGWAGRDRAGEDSKRASWVGDGWLSWVRGGQKKKKKSEKERERERERNRWMGGFIKLPLFSLSVAWHHSGIGAISQPLAESQFIHKAWTAASAPNDAMIQQSRQPDPTNKGQYAFYHAIEL